MDTTGMAKQAAQTGKRRKGRTFVLGVLHTPHWVPTSDDCGHGEQVYIKYYPAAFSAQLALLHHWTILSKIINEKILNDDIILCISSD